MLSSAPVSWPLSYGNSQHLGKPFSNNFSAKLCQVWNWVQPNGQPRDMVARSLMLQLHRAGHIQLPVQRFCPPNNAARHRAPPRELTWEAPPLECSLAELGPLEIRQVRRTPTEKLFGSLMEAHHYLA